MSFLIVRRNAILCSVSKTSRYLLLCHHSSYALSCGTKLRHFFRVYFRSRHPFGVTTRPTFQHYIICLHTLSSHVTSFLVSHFPTLSRHVISIHLTSHSKQDAWGRDLLKTLQIFCFWFSWRALKIFRITPFVYFKVVSLWFLKSREFFKFLSSNQTEIHELKNSWTDPS